MLKSFEQACRVTIVAEVGAQFNCFSEFAGSITHDDAAKTVLEQIDVVPTVATNKDLVRKQDQGINQELNGCSNPRSLRDNVQVNIPRVDQPYGKTRSNELLL